MDWATSQRITHQLDGLVKETNNLSNLLKGRIKKLHAVQISGEDWEIRKQQVTGPYNQRIFLDNDHLL